MRQRAPGSSPTIKGGINETNVLQRRGADRRRGSGGNILTIASGGGSAISSATSSWEITSGGDVALTVDHHDDHDDDDNSNSNNNDERKSQNAAMEQSMQDVDLLSHHYPHRYTGGASSLLQARSPASSSTPGLHQQQYISYNMLYQKATISEENLRKFRAASPLNISSAKSSTSTALLTSWKLDQARLEDYHTVFRTPLHVPDSEYEAFLLGRDRRKSASILTKQCCATACAGFSAVGVAFLLFVGILLDTQPLYIPGTLPELVTQSTFQYKNSDRDEVITYTKPIIQYLVPGPADERLPIATTAYKAALAYLCTFVASMYVLDPTRFQFLTRFFMRHVVRRLPSYSNNSNNSMVFQYTDIPDPYDDDFSRGSSNKLNTGASLPYYQHQHNNNGLWNRTTERVQRWLAVRGWYRVRRRGNKTKKKG